MSPTGKGVSRSGALLRFPGLVVRWVARKFAREQVGSDGLTDAEGKEYEAQFWKVATAPAPKDARLRAEREVEAGTRQVLRLRRPR
jgi:hypothetical protein